jgi:hypothetical protein
MTGVHSGNKIPEDSPGRPRAGGSGRRGVGPYLLDI